MILRAHDAKAGQRWLWAALLLLLWLPGLGDRALTRPDEGRYAEIGREMAQSGDWITPHLNGIPYYEKPPLQYWATAVAVDMLGPTPLAARLWTGLLGLLGLAAAAFFGRRLFGMEAGQRAPWILGSMVYYSALGHINTLDMGVSVWMFVAIGCFLMAQQERPLAWMMGAWAAATLGFLSKGLMALALPGATLVIYTLFTRDTSPWKRLALLPGLALMMLMTVPWFWQAWQVHPPFLSFFFIHEQFDRYTSTIHQRVEPIWYFLPILLAGLWPWTWIAFQALRDVLWRHHGRQFSPSRFLGLYAVFVVLFFSLSDSKLPDYILPAFPALALLTARHLALRPASLPASPAWLLSAGGGLLGLIALLLSFPGLRQQLGLHLDLDADMIDGYRHFARWIGAAAMLSMGAGGYHLIRQRHHLATPLHHLALAALGAAQLLLVGSDALAATQSGHDLARLLGPRFQTASHIYSVDTYDQTLDYYLQRTVVPVAYSDEMAFGLSLEPHHAIPSLEAFRNVWEHDAQALAILPPPLFNRLSRQGFTFHVLFQDAHRVIVARS